MDTYFKISVFLFSLIALVFSCYAISNQYYADIPAFVLSLVGICATLIVGVSVVDTIAVHKLEDKLSIQSNEMNNKLNELSKKLEEISTLEDKLRKMKKQTNILFHHTWGLAYSNSQPYDALSEFLKALNITVEIGDIKRAKTCITNAEFAVEEIAKRGVEDNSDINSDIIIPHAFFEKNIKESKVYVAFGERIEKLIYKIQQTIN